MQKLLETLVKIKLGRIRPTVIGITGSLGKTSTKEAIAHVLKSKWRVVQSQKSLNTEFGLLLAVLGQPSGFTSPLKWTRILVNAAREAFNPKPCDFLILEYGADRPGDIEHLVSLVPPHIGIITRIARVHQDEGQFRDEHAVFEEKKRLAESIPLDGFAVLNSEDSLLKNLHVKLRAKTFWFGAGGDIWAEYLKNTRHGFSATIHTGNQLGSQKFEAEFPVIGSFHISLFLPALLIGEHFGIPLKKGIEALSTFRLPSGRMSEIPGKNHSTLLDSSYNSSPEAMKQALKLLHDFPGGRKIAVLGNMNELGDYTERGHREIAREIGSWLHELVTVGESAAIIADECLKIGFPKSRMKILLDASAAAQYLQNILKKDDVVLFKGSQNRVRLERAVKALMAHPEDAKKLLCRQEPEWEGKE